MTILRRLSMLAVVISVGGLVAACGGGDAKTPRAQKTQCTYDTSNAGPVAREAKLPPGNPPDDLPTQLTIATNRGDIVVSLDVKEAPCTVNSFVSLAKQGYYDNTRCHRLVSGGLFVLQCGDPSATGKVGDTKGGTGGPGYSFADELVAKDPRLQPCTGQTDPQSGKEICTYTAGTLAMANSGPDTNGSQFFLVYKDSPLPAAYTVFGKMSASGVKVVQDVAKGGFVTDPATGGTPPRIQTVITSVS